MSDSEPMDIDGATPLSPREVEHIRRVLRDDDRTSWALKQLRVFVPILVAIVVAVWQAWAWLAGHVEVTP